MSVFKYYCMFFDFLYPMYLNKVFLRNIYRISGLRKMVLSNYLNNLSDSLDLKVIKSLFLLKYFSNKHPKVFNMDLMYMKSAKFYKYSGRVSLWKSSEFFLFIDFFLYCLRVFLKRRNILFPKKIIDNKINFYNFSMRDLGFFPMMGYFFFDWSYLINVSLVFKHSNLFNTYILKFLKLVE